LGSLATQIVVGHQVVDEFEDMSAPAELGRLLQNVSSLGSADQLPEDTQAVAALMRPYFALAATSAKFSGGFVAGTCLHSVNGGADAFIGTDNFLGKTRSIEKPMRNIAELAFQQRYIAPEVLSRYEGASVQCPSFLRQCMLHQTLPLIHECPDVPRCCNDSSTCAQWAGSWVGRALPTLNQYFWPTRR